MDLQNALLLIGAVIIVAVAISTYDKARLNIREQRRKARQAAAHSSGLDDVTGDTEAGKAASEPVLDINPGPPVDLQKRSLTSDVPVSGPATGEDSPFFEELESLEQVAAKPLDLGPDMRRPLASSQRTAPQDMERVFPLGHEDAPNPKIDFIVYLPGRGPVLRDQALGVFKQNEYVLEKPRQLYGLRYLVGRWSRLGRDPDDAQYSDLAVAIQMVDASGPIAESELSAFVQVALKLADAFKRPTKLAMTIEQALTRAKELQEFAETYDVIASVNVLADDAQGFSGREIVQTARDQGMHFGAMNIFQMKNENSAGCRHLFSMANLYQPGAFDPETLDRWRTGGLTFFMTIPCVCEPTRVFETMVEAAKALCDSLGGRLTDQNGKLLTDEGITAIQQQIKRIAADINAQGIVPGSEAALRFFSA
jgi:cell division protein ZipA